MSESSVKKYRRAMEKEYDSKRSEHMAEIILSMQRCTFSQRVALAWKILKGVKK